jgi:cysteine-rich repeat protein
MRLGLIGLASLSLALMMVHGCGINEPPVITRTYEDLDVSTCKKIYDAYEKKSATDWKCPTVTEKDCKGPGPGGSWSINDHENDPAKRKLLTPPLPPCEPAPAGGCVALVIGRGGDLNKYRRCDGYEVLELKYPPSMPPKADEWTPEQNTKFIACAQFIPGILGKPACDPLVVVATPNKPLPDIDPKKPLPNPDGIHNPVVTVMEVCQLKVCQKCTPMLKPNDTGSVTCPKPKKGKKPAPKDSAGGDDTASCLPCDAGDGGDELCGDCEYSDCGDGVVDTGEDCDDGNHVGGDGCSSECTTEECGDGEVTGSEQCDDGNTTSGDGCSSSCTNEVTPACGDGILQAGEDCDDGNTTSGDGCSSGCKVECKQHVCGDGTLEELQEECDDGNTVNGDGCNSLCQIEWCCPEY